MLGGAGMGQMPVPSYVWVPGRKDPFKEYPAWCESQLLSRVFGVFSDACVPQSEESVYAAGTTEIENMCERVARQGQQTFEECMERAAVNEPLYRAQYEAAIKSSQERDPEGYCEYEASQSHPMIYKLLGGKVACDYARGKFTIWIAAAVAGTVLLLARKR